ncbi:MAG: hypothetical protein WBQ57_02715, partial [Rhodanobacteraceae bacterium]
MRPIALRPFTIAALIGFAVVACSPSTPDSTAPAAAPAKPPAQTPPTTPTPAAKAAAPVPEGRCGDQSALPADQRIANTAHWTTASEQDNFGFDVYRGNSDNGPFTKLTKDPILGAGTSDET